MRARTPPPAAPGPTDTVPAMLTPGEFVVKRDAVRRIGVGKLNQLNRGYEEGGPVKADPPTRYLDPIQGRLLQAGEPAPTPAVPAAPSTPPVQTPVQSPAPAQPSPLPGPTPAEQPKVFAPDVKAVQAKEQEPKGTTVFAPDVKPTVPADQPKAGTDQPKEAEQPQVFAPDVRPSVPPEKPKSGPPGETPQVPASEQPPATKQQAPVDNLGILGDEGLIKDILAGPTPTTTAKQQAPQPIDTLKAGANNAVDPVALYRYLLGKFANSGLVGYIPPDGAKWGIKTGSAAEWAAFGLAVAKQESDLNTRSWNALDPGGSAGLFQFGQGQKPYVQGDQFDPQQSADAFVRAVQHFLANKGSIANLGATFGSIRRPNEAGQYIAGAQRVAAGGSGKDLVSSGGEGGGKGSHKGEPTLVPMPPGQITTSAPAQAQTPQLASTGGGGGGGRYEPQAPPSSGGYGQIPGGGLGDIVAGAVLASAIRGGGNQPAQRAQAPVEEEDPMVTALMNRGFSRSEAINFAQGSQAITPGKGIGPLQQPPSAPSAQAQLPAPVVTPKLLSPQQLMPSRYTKAPAPAAPSKPGQPKALPPPAPSATLGTGIISQAQRSPPPAKQAPTQVPTPSRYTGAPTGSTFGVPNPPGSEAITKWPRLVDQAKQHAAILSADDPRVKKQKDNMIKGEHFVGGDPFHEQLLSGLPYGKQGRQGQILAQAEQAIGEKQPLHISYISAPKEAALHPTRESRMLQYEEHSPEARLMGTTEGQLVGHSMIPVSVGISPSRKAGEPHQGYVQAISTNVLANNFQHVVKKLAEMGQKSPYEKLGTKFTNDLEGYLSNLNAGHVGTGQGHAVGTSEFPNTPDPNHVPYKLTRREADFLNLIINNRAAFAKHEDGQALRRLAESNGTLISAEGETNRIRHEMDQHEPGWSQNVLEPSIRTFKTGLIHEVHPNEEHMPATIRPGSEYRAITSAIQRTSERGRPDVPVAISPRSQPIAAVRRDLQQNAKINEIERHFSEDKITEEEARHRLHAIGENPDEYKFVSGSGGLVSPYEDDGEQLTQEEHNELKGNLKKQWLGGKMPIESYRQRVAEVPLPTKPSKPAVPSKEDEPGISPSSSEPAEPRQAGSLASMPTPAASARSTPSQESKSAPSPEPLAAPKPKPEASEEPAPAKPRAPAPDEPLPTPVKKPVKTPLEQAAVPPATKAAEPAEKLTKPPWEEADEKTRQDYLEKRVSQAVAGQSKDPRALKLKASRNEQGGVQYDPQGNPVWEKTDYDIANLPMLGKKGVNKIKGADEHEDTLGKDEHLHLNQVERRRLSAMRTASSVKTLGDHIADSYNSIKDIPEIAAGKGWYSRMRDKMKKHLGDDREIFAQLLGATSAKTPVRANFIQALDAYERYKEGKADPTNMNAGFNRHIAKYLKAYDKMHEGKGALLEHMKSLGIHDPEDKTDADAMASWIKHHNILPLQRSGAKYNANSNAVLKVLGGTWLKDVGAPKTPNFAGNLTGRTLAATIDVWAARHLHRIGTEDFTKGRWRPQSSAEPGVNSLDFAYSQDAMKHAADKIGINPDDLQAILWYAEKHHYEKSGWTRGQGAEKSSFDDVFDKVFENPSGQRMTAAEAQAHYQALGKAESARRSKIKTAKTQAARGDPKLAAYMEKHGLTHQEVHGDEDEEAA